MMKTRLFFTVTAIAALGLIAACAPKSRYRAIDIGKTTVTTEANKTKPATVTSEVTPTRKTLEQTADPDPVTDEAAKNEIQTIEFIGITKFQETEGSDKYSIDLYLTSKNGTKTETRVLNLKATSKSSISLEQVGRLSGADENEKISDSGLKVEGTCDEHCNNLKLTLSNSKTNISVTAKIDSQKMRISKADASKAVDKKVEDLVDKDLVIQQTRVRLSGKEFFTLSIGTEDGIVFSMARGKTIQKLPIIFGKKNGIETADYSGVAEKFDLTLRDKDGDVLADLKVGPVPAPVEAPVCDLKDAKEILTLTCTKQHDAKDERVKDTFVVKVTAKVSTENPGREFKYLLEGGTEQTLALGDEEASKEISSLKAATPLKFMIKGPNATSKASVLLTDACCEKTTKVTAP